MNNLVKIKGYKSGLSIVLNNIAPFDEILYALAENLENSRAFFGDSSMAIAFEGRWISDEDEKLLLQVIEEHSDLNVICIMGCDEETDRRFLKAVKRVESQRDDNNCRYYQGNIHADEVIEAEGNLIVIGNVEEGGQVLATKDIVVLGDILGDAFAGVNDREAHSIVAYSFGTGKIRVGDMIYHPIKESGIFNRKSKDKLHIVHVKNGVLALDEYR